MTEYDAEDEALAAASEHYLIEQTLAFIKAGKNVPPKDIAAALCCDRVAVPKEILHYAAGLLDGSPKKRGKPIDVHSESIREAFSDRDFIAEEIHAKYAEKKKLGVPQTDILEDLAEEYGRSVGWISKVMYPRQNS